MPLSILEEGTRSSGDLYFSKRNVLVHSTSYSCCFKGMWLGIPCPSHSLDLVCWWVNPSWSRLVIITLPASSRELPLFSLDYLFSLSATGKAILVTIKKICLLLLLLILQFSAKSIILSSSLYVMFMCMYIHMCASGGECKCCNTKALRCFWYVVKGLTISHISAYLVMKSLRGRTNFRLWQGRGET